MSPARSDAIPSTRPGFLRNLVRRTVALYRDPTESGWATRSFIKSMSDVSLIGMALMQVIAIGALFFEPGPHRPVFVLGAVHLVAAAGALASLSGRIPIWLTIVLAYGAFLMDWSIGATWNGPLLLAACWIANIAAALPGLTVAGRRTTLVPLVAAWVVPPVLLVTRPDLGPQLPVSVIVTATSIVVVFWFGLAYPLALVRQADRGEAEAHERDRQLGAQRAAVRKTAEDARVLHDTVINTLGAIARGGAAVADAELVRARCLRDIDTVEALRRGQASLPSDEVGIRAATNNLGVTVKHVGLSEDELDRSQRSLPDGVRRAVTRAVFELVRNVAKHSGVTEATIITTRSDGILTISVVDEGCGFDGVAPPGGGLAESVISRAREQGVDVMVSTAPGRGTRVTLTCWEVVTDDDDASGSPDVQHLVDSLVSRAGFAYAAGVAIVGLVLALTNHLGQFTEEFYMVLVIAVVSAVAWRAGRGGRPPGVVLRSLLIAGGCTAFVASAAAVDYGRTDVVYWQAIGPIGPLALLLALTRSRPVAILTVCAYVATVVGVIASTFDGNLEAAANVTIAGLVGLGLFVGWSRFQRELLRIGVRAADDHRRAAVVQRTLAAQAAATEAHRRWQEAGLDQSVALLRRIAEGTDPTDPDIREACGREESYLRKLSQLDPELVHMGRWFARALAEGHAADSDINVRSGNLDINKTDAATLGDLVVQTARRISASERLTATLYATSSGSDERVRLTLVGPGPRLTESAQAWADAEHYPVTLQTFGDQELLEIEIARSGERRTDDERPDRGATA